MLSILLSIIAASVQAQPVPYTLQDLKTPQDVSAINQNFRYVTDYIKTQADNISTLHGQTDTLILTSTTPMITQQNGVAVVSTTTKLNFINPPFVISNQGAGRAQISMAASGITAGTYGSATTSPACVFNSTGLAESCTNTTIQLPESQVTGLTADLAPVPQLGVSTNTLSVSTADLKGRVDSLGVSTNTISISTANLKGRVDSIGVSTNTLSISTASLAALVNVNSSSITTLSLSTASIVAIANVNSSSIATLSISTADLKGRVDSIGISTNTLSISTAALKGRVDLIGGATNTLSLSSAALSSRLDSVGVSTATLSLSTATLLQIKASSGTNTDISSMGALGSLGASLTMVGAATITVRGGAGENASLDLSSGAVLRAGNLILPSGGCIVYGTSPQCSPPAGGPSIGGSGTPTKIPKFATGSSLDDSFISQTSTGVTVQENLLVTHGIIATTATFGGGITLPSGSVFTGGWTEIAYSSGTGYVYPLFNFTGLVSTTSYYLKVSMSISTGSTTGDLLNCRFNNSSINRYFYANNGNGSGGAAISNLGNPATYVNVLSGQGTEALGDGGSGDFFFETHQSTTTNIIYYGHSGVDYSNGAGQYNNGGIFRGALPVLNQLFCWMPGIGAGPSWRARLFKYTSALGE